ncbi:DNA polymerase LigD, polymerase domain protein [Mycobacterium xenopi 3993]|nr:DNA polymerase LigD, polymerase domain protein [Mycobacterium xenopi 3993]
MPSAAEELDVDGITVRLTNPDRIYFPKLGSAGTKRRLVEYYRAVAPGPMLTALRDRPTHLQRFPDGIDGRRSTKSGYRNTTPTIWKPAGLRSLLGAPPTR